VHFHTRVYIHTGGQAHDNIVSGVLGKGAAKPLAEPLPTS